MVQDFKELRIWQQAHAFTLKIYKLTKCFPATERYGLTSQLCRASSSISANIAEGCGRRTDKELRQFLHQSYASCKECENHLILAKDLEYISNETYEEMYSNIDNICGGIYMLIKIISSKLPRKRF